MTTIDFRRLAEEAGFRECYSADMWGVMVARDIQIERFAKLVAEAAAKAEREECVRLCAEMERKAEGTDCCEWPTPSDCAFAIRARGEE
jgi:hypothetical protein